MNGGKPGGRIKSAPRDFVVEEVPAYAPSGEGDHLYVRFTKTNLTTDVAASRIAKAMGVAMRDVGIAGMKDKVAVTTQTVSLPIPRMDAAEFEARASTLSLEGIAIHACARHTNKLKTGHLAANTFKVVVRGIDPSRVDEAARALEEVGRTGIPNAFGPQRFGRDQSNAEQARAWLSGRAKAPRDARLRRLLFSSLQADLFNRVLDLRVEDGTWSSPLLGDLVKRRSSGALFAWTGSEEGGVDERGDVSPTGPLFGVKMRDPSGVPFEIEQRVLSESLGEGVDLSATRPLGEGSRRALRLWVTDLRVEVCAPAREEREQERSLEVSFVLPKGGYATSVLGTVFALQSTETPTASDSGEAEGAPGAPPAANGDADPGEASAT